MPGRHSPPLMDQAKAEETQHRNIVGDTLDTLAPAVFLPPSAPTVPLPDPLNTPAAYTSPLDAPSSTDLPPQPSAPDDPTHPRPGIILVDGIEFHHASEAEFARLLTYYGIEWEYEPHQFPLQWHEGRVVEMFRPDFYLTEYDLYIELTTMKQALVRRKNRKLRLLRALYPEISIKLIYRRDYQRLLERFGIRPEELEAERPPVELGDDD